MLKGLLSSILILVYILGFKVGYTTVPCISLQVIEEHLLFPFCHANIFHLLCNLLAFWSIRGKLYLLPSLAINLLASYLPTIQPYMAELPTYGFSGILFAIVGIKWGRYFTTELRKSWLEFNVDVVFNNARKFLFYVILPLFITIFIPNVNWSLHFYALTLGLLYGYCLALLSPKWHCRSVN